ncbi:MAG: McrC family protein [Oscillospiraceae bacterium]|nr:McrC family protein [Oscillospiraceae bacterium]
MGKRDRFHIKESEFFTIEGSSKREGGIPIPEHEFGLLEDFVYENPLSSLPGQPDYMLRPSGEGKERILTADGFAGAVVLKDGTQFEILPNLSVISKDGKRLSEKHMLLEMIQSVKSFPLGNYNINTMAAEKLNIFETFVLSFVNSCMLIINNGLKQAYVPFLNNENFLKGKVDYAKHATKNFAHKDKFYVIYDVFTINRAENRLIKSTLKYLRGITCSARTRNKIDIALANFDGVDYSTNYAQDFSASVLDRSMLAYVDAMTWAKVFLLKKSTVAIATGRNVIYSVMLPTEQLFDCYIAKKLGDVTDKRYFSIEMQHKIYPVLNRRIPNVEQKPGMFLTRKEDRHRVIIDAKWQGLDEEQVNYGIRDIDIYNAYNMQEKYNASTVYYLYPLTEKIRGREPNIVFRDGDNILGRVCFLDMSHIEDSLSDVLDQIYNDETQSRGANTEAG